MTSPPGRGLSAFVLPTIRASLLSSVVLASAGWAQANPAKVHAQVLQELNAPVTESATMPEVTRAEQQARAALKRATDAQKASDSKVKSCAPIYAETALEWAQFRNELARLAALQRKVRALQKRVSDANAALKREQAYLEETEARRGRALATLEQLKAAPGSSLNTPSATSMVPQSTPDAKSPAVKGSDNKTKTVQGQK